MERLFSLLTGLKSESAFNQYRDTIAELDLPDGAAIRRANLSRYLKLFSGAAYVLVGEAAGYAGCRFSGIPFTGEAQLVGPGCLPWASGADFAQSSCGKPWREMSGTIVWGTLGGRRDCVLWNAFPWHPFGAKPLSNRRPRQTEMVRAREVLVHFLSLFSSAQVYAIGRMSQRALGEIGVKADYIRHPSHGGKPAFVSGVASLPVIKVTGPTGR